MKFNSEHNLKIFLGIILLGILISQSYMIFDLRSNFNTEISNLENSVNTINNKVDTQKSSLQQEISNLRKETSDAVEGLGGNINQLREEASQSQEDIKKLSEDLEDLENVQIEASQDFSLIVEDVIKSVVSIKAGNSIGSGVFVSPKYLITNYHVVGNLDKVIITNVDGNSFQANVLSYEPNVDIALLEVPNGNFPYLEFEDNSNIKTGERVIAVGSPLGLSFSVTQGIISSKERTGPNNLNIYLQTDTPINPGNSGGPLINLDKKIVAINTWKIANVEGLGFAIRSEVVKDIYEQMVDQL